MNPLARLLRHIWRCLATLCRVGMRVVWRFVRVVFIDTNKPPQHYQRWSTGPGPAFDATVFGLFIVSGLAYMLT